MGWMTKTIAVLSAGIVPAMIAVPASAQSIATTLSSAYENSGLLEQNRALLRAADEDVAQAQSALAPILSWAANSTWTDPVASGDKISSTASLSASILLYDFGGSQAAIEATKEVVLSTRQQLIDLEQEVLLRAISAHLDVLRFQEFVRLRENNVRVITQQLRAANDRFEVGEVTRTDVSQAEAFLAEARANLAASQGDLAQAVEEYRLAAGIDPTGLAAVPRAAISYSEDEAKAFALRNHPSIRAAQHNVSAAELNIAQAEAALRPTVDLSGRLALDLDELNDGFETNQSVTLSIGGPISQGGRLASSIRQAMARRDAQRASLHVTSQNIEGEVGVAYALLAVSRASRDATDRQIRASRVAFDGIQEEADLGARTTLDVLDAEQDLLDAQVNSISAAIDETLAGYRVLSAMGVLTAEDLNLGVQSYDPAAYYNLVKDAPLGLSERGQALDRVLRAIGD